MVVNRDLKTKTLRPTKARIKGEVIYDWNVFHNNAEYEDFIVTRSAGSTNTTFKNESCATQLLEIEFQETTLTVTATDTTVNVANTITVHLTRGENNTNMANTPVVVMIRGETFELTTNSSGVATLNTWTSSVTLENVFVEVAYAGDISNLYKPAQASTYFNVT